MRSTATLMRSTFNGELAENAKADASFCQISSVAIRQSNVPCVVEPQISPFLATGSEMMIEDERASIDDTTGMMSPCFFGSTASQAYGTTADIQTTTVTSTTSATVKTVKPPSSRGKRFRRKKLADK